LREAMKRSSLLWLRS